MGDGFLIAVSLVGAVGLILAVYRLAGGKAASGVFLALLPAVAALGAWVKGKKLGRAQEADRVEEHVDEMVEDATRARDESDRRNADDERLRDSDGFRRD